MEKKRTRLLQKKYSIKKTVEKVCYNEIYSLANKLPSGEIDLEKRAYLYKIVIETEKLHEAFKSFKA